MPGSRSLPFGEVVQDGRLKDKDGILQVLSEAGIDPGRPIITSCGSGVTAAILSVALESTGLQARSIYDGSWAEWGSRDDLPVATGPAEGRG
jgi:thiosulfate/3-mercaptopyruvate sulfurtransferase